MSTPARTIVPPAGSSGDKGLKQLTHNTVGMDVSLADMTAKYGEDNGRYLYEELTRYRNTYQRLTYIDTGLEPDNRFEEEARWEAAEAGWKFEKLAGRSDPAAATSEWRLEGRRLPAGTARRAHHGHLRSVNRAGGGDRQNREREMTGKERILARLRGEADGFAAADADHDDVSPAI